MTIPLPKPGSLGLIQYAGVDMLAYGDARAAEERERCAKVCEDARNAVWEYHEPGVKRAAVNVCENLAAAIRAGS